MSFVPRVLRVSRRRERESLVDCAVQADDEARREARWLCDGEGEAVHCDGEAVGEEADEGVSALTTLSPPLSPCSSSSSSSALALSRPHSALPPLPSAVPLSLSLSNDVATLLRVTRSTGPREVLLRLAVQRHLLVLQVNAVRVQSIVRRFLARRRARTMRERVRLFVAITQSIADKMIEEQAIAASMEIVMFAMKSAQKYKETLSLVLCALEDIADEIVEEKLVNECSQIVKETLNEAMDVVLSLKPRVIAPVVEVDLLRTSHNPLIQACLAVSDDACDSLVRGTVVDAVCEEVAAYLLLSQSLSVYDETESDVVSVLVRETLFDALISRDDQEVREIERETLRTVHTKEVFAEIERERERQRERDADKVRRWLRRERNLSLSLEEETEVTQRHFSSQFVNDMFEQTLNSLLQKMSK